VPTDRNAETRRIAIERHIEDGRRRVALFRGLIAQAASQGGDTTLAGRILTNMESAVCALEETWRANGGVLREVPGQAARSCPSDNDRWHRLIDEWRDAVDSLREVRDAVRRRAA
jgi:hypothetical protein